MKNYLLLFVFFLLYAHTNAQENNKNYSISLKAIGFVPNENAHQWLDSILQNHSQSETLQVIVQFYQLPTAEQKIELQKKGVFLKDYLPHYAYTAILHVSAEINIAASGIRSIIPISPFWKMDDSVNSLLQNPSGKITNVLVSFYKDQMSKENISSVLKDLGATISNKKFELLGAYEININSNNLLLLASNPFVKYINIARNPVVLNDDVRGSSGANITNPNFTDSLTGKGITIGIGDNCAGIYHADTRDRTINFNPFYGVEHGSHTTGTAAGNGIINPRAMGMAHDASVLGLYFDIGWIQTPNLFPMYNMTITNNSYAAVVGDCNYAGTYDQYASMLDDISYNNPQVLHVFAAANDGLMTCNGYAQGYATVAGGYQPAKNNLVVGGIRKNYVLAEKSSRGPVKDGRLKPEILSIGWGVLSCTAGDQYVSINGTSMACPGVVGGLALLSQQYQKQYHKNPYADLLKALMINGAIDLGNPGPDYLHGFGLMNIQKSIQMLKDDKFFEDSVQHNGQKSFSINVPPNTSQLKVTICYNDIPALALANDALINDLDLELKDPNNLIHHPLILNPSISGVVNLAIEGIDTLNNTEQIIVNNPISGTYTIAVNGTLVTNSAQRFAVAYDLISSGINLKFPAKDIPIAANDTTRIYWDASDDNTNPINIQYSDNGGNNWYTIVNNLPATQKYYTWNVPNMVTDNAIVRITRGAQQNISGIFTIAPQPLILLDTLQCPGYLKINWNPIPGINTYEVLQKKGENMLPIASVSANSYTFSGLSMDSTYYVSVRPIVNGKKGLRSLSIIKQPNTGNCMGNMSDNDLMIIPTSIPSTGRKNTTSERNSNDSVVVYLKNLDDNPNNNYKLSYQLNGGIWQSQIYNQTLNPLLPTAFILHGLNLSSIGNYKIRIAVENLQGNDPVKSNDSINLFISQLANAPIDLITGFTDSFETGNLLTLTKDSIGFTNNFHWDYNCNTSLGRIRNYVSKDVLISGNHSLSLDLSQNGTAQNFLTGTFNLATYDTTSNDVRMELDYKLHGIPKFLLGNQILIRGNDQENWLPIYYFDTSAAKIGITQNTGSLAVTHLLQQNKQQFSSSFQIGISQEDTSVIAMNEYGNGLTIDNFKLYSVTHDLQLLAVVSPNNFYCDVVDNVPVSIKIYNSDNLQQYNIKLYYQLNGSTVVSQTLDSIAAKDTLVFTFNKLIDHLLTPNLHKLNVWIVDSSDSYHANDSVLNYNIRSQQFVHNFPYLENFEMDNGGWYTEGKNSTWEYGKPNGPSIKNAASGKLAWATNLNGNYNDKEHSYLYSMCYDLSKMNNPALSFSLATDIEDCGANVCDYLSLEYTFDGEIWLPLNPPGGSFNWFNCAQGWKGTDNRWRVASVFLPKTSNTIRLRFVFHSDNGTSKDGVAIDDIHIYDHLYGICNESPVILSHPLQINTPESYIYNNQILGEITSSSALNGSLNMYQHNNVFQPHIMQYFLPRNYVVNAPPSPLSSNNSIDVKLYITDEDFLKMNESDICDSCLKADDVYRMGITEYLDNVLANLDGSILNNNNGDYRSIPYSEINWIPFDIGYYAKTTVYNQAELWFNLNKNGKINEEGTLYPNPVTNQSFTLQWVGKPNENYEISICDVLGKKVFQQNGFNVDFDNFLKITLPSTSQGIYFLNFISSSTQFQKKILIK